jgi:hypothetical protein
VIRETSPGRFGIIQKLALGTGGMFMALDSDTHFLYFPVTHFFVGGPKSDIVVVSPVTR